MPQTFTPNSNNDIFIGTDARLAISVDIEAVKYACASAAKAQRGEMVFALTSGVPNFQVIWTGAPNIPQLLSVLRKIFLNTPGVLNVVSLNAQLNNNILSYTAVIKTTYGQAGINAIIGSISV